MKNLCLILSILILFACFSNKKQVIPVKNNNLPRQREIVLEKSANTRPDWLINEPNKVGDYLIFVGISENSSTELNARKSALRNAIINFAKYCGVEVNDLYRGLSASFGLDSEIKNSTNASLNTTEMKTHSFVSRVKAKKYYYEVRALTVDNEIIDRYYKVYVYATVPYNEYQKVLNYKKNIGGK